MKRAIFLGTAALLALLVLAPMAWAQGGTTIFNPCEPGERNCCEPGEELATSMQCHQGPDVMPLTSSAPSSASASPFPVPPRSGGPAIVRAAARVGHPDLRDP